MKRILNKHLRLNKMSISQLNVIMGGTKDQGAKPTHNCPPKTMGDDCTTSRTTVDFSSNGTHC